MKARIPQSHNTKSDVLGNTLLSPNAKYSTKSKFEKTTRFNEQLKQFSTSPSISKIECQSVNPKVNEIYRILEDPEERMEMLVKSIIRPDLKKWCKEKYGKSDLEKEIKLRTMSNLGIPLLPVHKMCRTEKNKI